MKVQIGKYILNSDKYNLENEQWKDIEGYEGLYEISNMGRIRNKDKKILKPQDNGKGYFKIVLHNGKTPKRYYIHRLVAEAFVTKQDGANIVNHLDECPSNNRASNLEWTTNRQNLSYGTAPQRHKQGIHRYWQNNKSKQRKRVLCVETNEVFDSHEEASRAKGTFGANISKCLNGKRHTAGGYHWKSIKEGE